MATFKKIFTIISYIVTILLIVYIIYEAIPKRTVSPAIDGVRFVMVTETLFTRTSETTDSENNQIKAVYEKLPRKFHLYVNGEEVPLDGETQEN